MPNGTQDPQQPRKRGPTFGERLKGVGQAIGRGIKATPGYVYREAIIPYGKHLRSKFTEPVDITHLAGPIDRLPIGMGRRPISRDISSVAGPIRDLPIGMGRTLIRPAPQRRYRGQGRTGAYDRRFRGAKSAVERLNEQARAEGKVISPTPKEPRTALEGRRELPTDLTAGTRIGDVVTVIGEMPREERKPPPRYRKPRPWKFSPKKTAQTLTKAAKARREQMAAVPPPDPTAREMARMMTEEEIAREAQRVEAELRQGRRPRRERARYRYRVRGMRRNENRGR